jgi:hypothetical protein
MGCSAMDGWMDLAEGSDLPYALPSCLFVFWAVNFILLKQFLFLF